MLFPQEKEAGEETSSRSVQVPGQHRGPLEWLRWLSLKLQRPDKESYICYVLFVALFLTDFSLLALVLQVLLFCYALLAQPAARRFWQASTPPKSCSGPQPSGTNNFTAVYKLHAYPSAYDFCVIVGVHLEPRHRIWRRIHL